MRSPLATRPSQLLLHVVVTLLLFHAVGSARIKPNILLIVVDDLGFGDVGFRSADTATGRFKHDLPDCGGTSPHGFKRTEEV